MEATNTYSNGIGFFSILFMAWLFYILPVVVYRLFVKPRFKYSSTMPFRWHLLFGLTTGVFPYLIILSVWQSGERKTVFDGTIKNPCNETVEELLAYTEHISFTNHPNEWNALRSMWNVINHSPNVTSDLKRKVIASFTSKGLYLNNVNVINNYNKTDKNI